MAHSDPDEAFQGTAGPVAVGNLRGDFAARRRRAGAQIGSRGRGYFPQICSERQSVRDTDGKTRGSIYPDALRQNESADSPYV
jgi:hypothetical protein